MDQGIRCSCATRRSKRVCVKRASNMRADWPPVCRTTRTTFTWCLTARDLNPTMHIVARAAEEQAESKLIRAGANRVVAPTIIGGHRMAMALTKPAVGDFLDSLTPIDLELGFEQLEVEAGSALIGRSLSETNIRSELDIVVVSIRRSHGEIVFNPTGDAKIETGDMLIAIGRAEALAETQRARTRSHAC